MRTGLHRWLIPALAAAIFAPVLVTLWVGLHVARHHDDAGHHHEAAHHHEAVHQQEAGHHHAVDEHETGHHHGGHRHEGAQHGAAVHHYAVHHDSVHHDAAPHDAVRHYYDGSPHHSHVTPDPRHEPAARRGLVSAPAAAAQAALPMAVPPPRAAVRLGRTHPALRGPPTPLFTSHCALLL